MSYIGYTPNNLGEKFNVVSTHYTTYDLIKDWNGNLLPNSLIICSPLKPNEGNIVDYGSYALAATDSYGYVVRLSYNIIAGNGLKIKPIPDSSYDCIGLSIDKDSINVNDYESLHVVKPNIIDNNTLAVVGGNEDSGSSSIYRTRIGVVTANLDKATTVSYGIAKGDETTIRTYDGVLTVNTYNLDYVDDRNNTSGIVRFNPDITDEYDWRTIEASNGILRVLTYNLDRATSEQVGVVKPDSSTTYTHNGELSVITAGLEKATQSSYGIIRPDNRTIEVLNGVVTANSRNMAGATSSKFGVVKLDSYSLGTDFGGYTYVNRYPEIVTILNRYLDDYNYIISRLIDHENRITALENAASAEYIYSFHNYGTSTTVLTEPYWDPDLRKVISDAELKTVVFSINTNCPFNVSFEFNDNSNITPQITLQTVRLGSNTVVEASSLQNYIFNSTNMNESTLSLTFNCKNYTSNSPEAFTMTNVTIKVSSINNSAVCASGSHIFKRWNTTRYIVNDPIYSEVTSESISYSHEYIGPYLQYYSDGELQSLLDNYVNHYNENGPDSPSDSEITAAVDSIKNVNDTEHEYEANNMNLRTWIRSYDNSGNLGTYVYITANQTARTSYNFLFSTLYVDKTIQEITTTTRLYKGTEELIGSYNGYVYPYDTPEYKYYYSISYGSSPIYSDNQNNYRYPIVDTVVITYERNKTFNGIGNAWDVNNDISNQFSYSISTLASNTGRYNVLTLSSTTPLADKDRRITVTLKSDAPTINANYHTNDDDSIKSILDNISFGTESNALKFSLIEDLQLGNPVVNISCQCADNADNPMKINVSRSQDSVVNGDAGWSVELKYYFVTSSGLGIDKITPANGASEISVFGNSNLYTYTCTFNNAIYQNQFPVPLETNYYPESLVNYYSGEQLTNNISTVKIVSCTVHNLNNTPVIVPAMSSNYYPCVYGTWPIRLGETPQPMSFNDAEIKNVSIAPWGDDCIEVSFDIRPGTHTLINSGASIKNNPNVTPNIVFYDGNNPISWSEYYTNCYINDTNINWSGTGCTVKMVLNNLASNGGSQTSVSLFNKDSQTTQLTAISTNSPLLQTNTKDGAIDRNGNTITNNASLGISRPLLYNITGIKFKFGLTIQGEHGLNFLTCTGDLTSKVSISANYNNGGYASTSIINALYIETPGVTVKDDSNEDELTKSSVSELANELAKSQEEIENLKNLILNNI